MQKIAMFTLEDYIPMWTRVCYANSSSTAETSGRSDWTGERRDCMLTVCCMNSLPFTLIVCLTAFHIEFSGFIHYSTHEQAREAIEGTVLSALSFLFVSCLMGCAVQIWTGG